MLTSKENPVNNESSLGQSGRAGRTPESVTSEQSQYFVAFVGKINNSTVSFAACGTILKANAILLHLSIFVQLERVCVNKGV